MSLIGKWKKVLDNKGYVGTILMKKDTINHDLLIAKLRVYGFPKESLTLTKSYLTNRRRRTKLSTGFSKWTEIRLGIPQRSVLSLFLFDMYLY